MGDCYLSMNFSVLPETPQAETTQSFCQGTHLPTVVEIQGKVAHRLIGPQAQLTRPPAHRLTGSSPQRLTASPPRQLTGSPAASPAHWLTACRDHRPMAYCVAQPPASCKNAPQLQGYPGCSCSKSEADYDTCWRVGQSLQERSSRVRVPWRVLVFRRGLA